MRQQFYRNIELNYAHNKELMNTSAATRSQVLKTKRNNMPVSVINYA